MKPYSEYKESREGWLGEVPAHWSVLRTKYLVQIKKRIAGTLGYDVLSVTQRGIRVKDTESGDGQLAMDYSKYQLVESGDFAMNHMDLLTGFIDVSRQEGVTSPDYRVFSLRTAENSSRYYLYVYQMAYTHRIFYSLGQGSAQLGRWRLPRNNFENYLVPLPPLAEQEKIAAFLDYETSRMDRLIEKQERLIELLKEKRQAVISHAVTKGLDPDVPMKDSGVEWLGEVPAHWRVGALKYMLDSCDSQRIPLSGEDRALRQGTYPYYGASGVIDYIDDYIFSEDRVLVGEDGANLVLRSTPLAFVARGRYWVNNHAHILRPRDGLCDYWAAVIENVDVTTKVSGAAQPKLTAENLGSILVAFPPSPDERMKISRFLAEASVKVDAVIDLAQLDAKLLRERRTALTSAAVTGKIDVRDWDSPREEAA